jgi:DNA-binding IclR family transcriptional regulator
VALAKDSGVAVMAFLPEREFARAMSQAEQMVAQRSGPWTTMAELERALRAVRRTGAVRVAGPGAVSRVLSVE